MFEHADVSLHRGVFQAQYLDGAQQGVGRRLPIVPVLPQGRVGLDELVELGDGCCETVWGSLTAAEAERLAQALLVQAQAIGAEA